MSIPIFLPITINVENAIQPIADDPIFAQTGEQFVITNPSTNSQDAVVIIGPNDGGIVTVASGTPGANVVFAGDPDTTVEIGTAFSIDANGSSNFLSGAGSAFQVDSTFEGSLIANLSGSITDGAGNDQIKGSQASDFIRVVKATTTSTAALAMTSSVLVAATTP